MGKTPGGIRYSLITFSLYLSLFFACTTTNEANDLAPIVDDYYKTYQNRTNFQKFLHFYDEAIVLEDIISGTRITGKSALADFFDWENPDFHKMDSVTLVIEDQIISKNKVVTSGYFTPFRWKEAAFEAMYFSTTLEFNQEGKIVKQVDWINYPSNLLDYANRSNANHWILNTTTNE